MEVTQEKRMWVGQEGVMLGRLVRGPEGVGSWKAATEGSDFGEFPRSGVLPSRHFHFNSALV